MKNRNKIMLFVILLSIFGVSTYSLAEAEVTFGEITVTPVSPTAQSTITISTNISGEIPVQVNVIVTECNAQICFIDPQNVTMSTSSTGNYQAIVSLRHEDAIYINCSIVVKINDTWKSSPNWKIVYLSENTNGNGNGNGNDDNGTPGFELIFAFGAVGICLILLGKKRPK